MRAGSIHQEGQLTNFGAERTPAAIGQAVIAPLGFLTVSRVRRDRRFDQAPFLETLNRFYSVPGPSRTEPPVRSSTSCLMA